MTRGTSPAQTRKPLPTILAMSNAPSEPTASPIPIRPLQPVSEASGSIQTARPHPKPSWPKPKLRFECRDLTHPAAIAFFDTTNPAAVFSNAVTVVLERLYAKPTESNSQVVPVRSITLILRSMDGVAYTTGSELDDEHKEIHFSLNYIDGIPKEPNRQKHEIEGVVVHEMVHCWQWNALGTCPGGLIEGIADFVRLKAGLSPPHWKKEAGGDWDAGYQHTAYFLEWIEEKFGEGSVRRINDGLRNRRYDEKSFWTDLFGYSVQNLWNDYTQELKKGKEADRS
jgi:hypothetical protein